MIYIILLILVIHVWVKYCNSYETSILTIPTDSANLFTLMFYYYRAINIIWRNFGFLKFLTKPCLFCTVVEKNERINFLSCIQLFSKDYSSVLLYMCIYMIHTRLLLIRHLFPFAFQLFNFLFSTWKCGTSATVHRIKKVNEINSSFNFY